MSAEGYSGPEFTTTADVAAAITAALAGLPGDAVVSVNTKTGAVVITAADVGASPSGHTHDARYYTETELDALLTAALASYLLKTGTQTYTGDLTVSDVGGTKKYRLKSSGGDLDLDGAGKSLFVSVYVNPDFTGGQRVYLRLEDGAQLAHMVGRWILAPTAFSGVYTFDGDSATGLAKLGAVNNGVANWSMIPFGAKFNGTGPPSTGTIAANQVGAIALCNDGLYEATAAGSPGTWVKRG